MEGVGKCWGGVGTCLDRGMGGVGTCVGTCLEVGGVWRCWEALGGVGGGVLEGGGCSSG